MDIGKRIRDIRLQNNLKQNDLANIIGVTKSTMSNYELNRSTPDYDTLKRVASYFNISIDYFLDHHINRSESLVLHDASNNYDPVSQNLSKDEMNVLKYYQRLIDENKDYIKGKMIDLYKEQTYLDENNNKKEIL